MRYMATIYISDVLEVCAGTIEVQGWEQQFGAPEQVYAKTVVWQGVGDDNPQTWLETALSEMLQESRATTRGRVS
jgi:hypothetical protein